jgi:hypothetical protein
MAENRDLIGRNVSALCETPTGQAGHPSTSLTVDQAIALTGLAKARPTGPTWSSRCSPVCEPRKLVHSPHLVVTELRNHRIRQTNHRHAVGTAWNDHDLVFCKEDGTQLDAMRVLRGLRRITKKAGIGSKWRARELRHSFVSILSDEGISIERIADLVGHSTPTTTQSVYRQQIRPVITQGAEAMDSIFGRNGQFG